MIYAIDRYEIGLEKEVSADLFYGKYIPRKSSRFFCPECGEPVFWKSRGGSQGDKFSHHPKTDWSPECTQRVDGHAKLNLYERVGLPVYLTVRAGNQFCLNIGFPAVGELLLLEAALQEVKVCVTGAEYRKTIAVDAGHFLENNVTLVPVNFIPKLGENFVVKITPDAKAVEIRRKWSDYADGFGNGGAIFTYGETGGKKIRRGGNVSPDQQYYVIARQFDPPWEIQSQRLGTISLSKEVYSVYLITICVSTENANRYQYVKKYLQKEFGIWLLQTSPELIPLWPPVTERGVLVPVQSHAKMYCAVSSGKDDPNVYRYDGTEVFSLAVEKGKSDIHTVVFFVDSQEVLLSVDRKYAGREVAFQAKEIVRQKFEYSFSIEKENGALLEWKDVTKEVLSEAFFLNANAKTDIYIGCRDKTFQHIAVREQRVAVPARYNTEEILFVAENGVFLHVRAEAAAKTEDLRTILTVDTIRDCCSGEWVPVPYWVENVLLECRRAGLDRIFEEVKKMIGSGRIPIGLLKVLHNCCNKAVARRDATYET